MTATELGLSWFLHTSELVVGKGLSLKLAIILDHFTALLKSMGKHLCKHKMQK